MRPKEPESALAAVLGGAVTRERLVASAAREGERHSPLVRSLLAQSLPGEEDLAHVYAEGGRTLRLEPALVEAAAAAARLLDPRILRRERCLPVAVYEDLCVLAVEEPTARRAVRAVRAALGRDVLPVVAPAGALARALDGLAIPPVAVSHGPARRKDSPIHQRFRTLVLEGALLDGIPVGEERA